MFHFLRKIVHCNIFLYNERLLIDFSLMPFMGYKSYYRIVGEVSEKAPLLLLHGGPGSTHNYCQVLICWLEEHDC